MKPWDIHAGMAPRLVLGGEGATLTDLTAYDAANRAEIQARRGVSAHRRSADMGVIGVLKWVS